MTMISGGGWGDEAPGTALRSVTSVVLNMQMPSNHVQMVFTNGLYQHKKGQFFNTKKQKWSNKVLLRPQLEYKNFRNNQRN